MTRQTWTALVSALCFAACVLVVAVVPVPFAVWTRGAVAELLPTDTPVIKVDHGATAYPTSGRLLAVRLGQTPPGTGVSLLEALYAYWADDREVVPLGAVYPAGASAETVATDEASALAASELGAKAAALRTAGVKVDPVPVVSDVNAAGPSAGRLLPGDVVQGIRYVSEGARTVVQTAADASAVIASGKVGEQLIFSVVRDGLPHDIGVITAASKSNPDLPVAGITFAQAYRYEPVVSFQVPDGQIGADSGLPLALALYDVVTPDPLLAGRTVAATGTLDANGAVGRVPGIKERVLTAERAGASVLVLPSANCTDLGDNAPNVRIVAVKTLAEAVEALGALADPAREKTVKGCS